jgi:hypothetical protein
MKSAQVHGRGKGDTRKEVDIAIQKDATVSNSMKSLHVTPLVFEALSLELRQSESDVNGWSNGHTTCSQEWSPPCCGALA